MLMPKTQAHRGESGPSLVQPGTQAMAKSVGIEGDESMRSSGRVWGRQASVVKTSAEGVRVGSVRVNWEIKAILPVAFVLLNGLLLFLLSTISLRDPERHAVLVVAGAGAVAICAVLIVALAYLFNVRWWNCRSRLPVSVTENSMPKSASRKGTMRLAILAETSIAWFSSCARAGMKLSGFINADFSSGASGHSRRTGCGVGSRNSQSSCGHRGCD